MANNEDVAKAIGYCIDNYGVKLKRDSNPYNFMKDLLRGPNANSNWPESLTKSRITGVPIFGDGKVFKFVGFEPDQTEPFPNPFEPTPELKPDKLQSISIPLTTKLLGRADESWLIQVAVNLRVIEQHLAAHSPFEWIELVHLQIAVKLGSSSEVDALFLGVIEEAGVRKNVLVTCEAKQRRDPLLGEQIVRQVRAAFKSVKHLDLDIFLVVPIGLKPTAEGSLYVVEFEAWTEEQAASTESTDLVMASRALYQLTPPVPGVGVGASKRRRAPVKPAV
ncbi:MAG: hypothetical protein EON58_02305 [Alphaproteobacteria bacterium]|nr:MAG: hypothetical protein EON58_02305 [Alphaproteobacteria bacterium]